MKAGKRALLLVAHGSRLSEANAEVARLAERLREASGDQYEIVTHAFLEIAEPGIPTGIDACIAQGATQLWVLPYFLVAGRHVRDDVPALLEQARERHPQIAIYLCAHLGAEAGLPELLLRLAKDGTGNTP